MWEAVLKQGGILEICSPDKCHKAKESRDSGLTEDTDLGNIQKVKIYKSGYLLDVEGTRK